MKLEIELCAFEKAGGRDGHRSQIASAFLFI
jgi:hypothetical protein